ncbi:MAG: NAD(P)H-dependent oxidoreductase [Patescibacteria group bacterium]|nr:NAD(P)H-dependent oxidoreductase [Patescibacteria group bacterium]
MRKKQLAIILGTAREGRQSFKVAEYIYNYLAKDEELDTVLVDIKKYAVNKTIPPWQKSEETLAWRELVKNSDAFILVVPEYNHGYPGELKIVLDQEAEAYVNKPIVLAGVSAGKFGGTRVVEAILPVLNTLGLRNLPHPLYFPEVETLFAQSKEDIDNIYLKKIDNIVKLIKEVLE